MANSIIQDKKEIWKDIKGYKGLYQVSNLGRIKSIKKEYIFKENKNGNGYRIVTLTKNKIEKSFSVHQLVANHFIPNSNNLPQVNHKDGNKMNNDVDNLEWCTQSDNMKHAYLNKLEIKNGKKVVQFDLDMNIIKVWDKITNAEKELGISHGKICMVCQKKRNKAGGYIWRYYEKI